MAPPAGGPAGCCDPIRLGLGSCVAAFASLVVKLRDW